MFSSTSDMPYYRLMIGCICILLSVFLPISAPEDKIGRHFLNSSETAKDTDLWLSKMKRKYSRLYFH